MAASKNGSSTSALAFGGPASSPITGKTELWNGTSWAEQNDLSTARYSLGGSGNATAALGFGGGDPTKIVSTEEWTSPVTTTVSFDVS